ncbi:hypothetical protein ABZV75_10285 [Streptomyces flaveolus]|uniref:hypothetical protein n=1 Tax=Streptomyces flaveolus TaxID=67297 RepID=UPI0033A3C9BD
MAAGTWWPLAVAVVVVIAAGIAYGRLAPVQGLQAVLVYQGGLLLAAQVGPDRTVRWEDIRATEYTPESYRDERLGAGQTRTTRTYERGMIWIAGVAGAITPELPLANRSRKWTGLRGRRGGRADGGCPGR